MTLLTIVWLLTIMPTAPRVVPFTINTKDFQTEAKCRADAQANLTATANTTCTAYNIGGR